ncbi:plasmid mobilization protein [Rhizosphaericola mali]|uniref:Plasmid mobilization relaxosome protein MobC n=1 Tax=Rhizosphaericola mali TaxID=2545455 RepID=A0A5P2G8X3_9BACT|nr:plasmid mobilization relaxosome protein MobC [Rhizosphaericola mali]QES89663.1 plasmid mobilization relaxosome protein MobC [Rhizosphaericola mali]
MESHKQENRNLWLHVRLTISEMNQVRDAIASSTERKISTYARKLILGQPVILKVRNASTDAFIQELNTLKRELSAIGSNFNQVVKNINTFKDSPEGKIWFPLALENQKRLIEKTGVIQKQIQQFARQWLQK